MLCVGIRWPGCRTYDISYMHVQNKKNGIMGPIKKRSSTFTIYHIAYILLQRNDIDFVHSVSSYNSDRVPYPTFQINYGMLLSLKSMLFL